MGGINLRSCCGANAKVSEVPIDYKSSKIQSIHYLTVFNSILC